jgi:SAM-dependent methyltransferase
MTEFDGYKEIYEAEIDKALRFSGKSHDFFTRVKADNLVRLLSEHFGSGKPLSVLDIGCGIGSIHPILLDRWPLLQLSGIDVARAVIADARKKQPDVLYDLYDGNALPYPTATFDAAFTICVMHHVPSAEWSGFMSEMRRVVRPGGIVVVIEHNPMNPLTRKIVSNCPLDKNAVLLTSAQLGQLMRGAGLEDVKSEYILFTPFGNEFFRKIDRALSRIPLGAQYITCGRVTPPSRSFPGHGAATATPK